MKRNYFIVIVGFAILSLFIIFFSLWWDIESPVKKEISPLPLAPFKSYISGVGIVEPSSENIFIGTPLNRIIEKVFVVPGSNVKKGNILFQLDDRDLQANLMVQLANYKSAVVNLQKLEALPRKEELAEAIAEEKNSKAELDLAKKQYEMVQSLPDPRAISQEEKNRRYFNFQQAEAKWQQAHASFEKIKAGTWKPDLEIARFEVQKAKANFNSLKTEIERTIIRSPIDGTVLQVDIHAGEFPPLDTQKIPMIILGNIDQMNVRVSINQLDIPYFKSSAPAVAYLQGDRLTKFPLEFIRVEPFLVSKQNLTNDISEKVDTRVLRIIYRIKKENSSPLYVGQQMDVFIETKPSP